MNLNIKQFTTEISNALAATEETYTVETIDLCDETSCEITKHGSTRKLYITPVEDGLIDMVIYDGTGTTLANGTLFDKATTNITPEKLAHLIEICL